jgi:hypothetical protein
MTLREWEHYYEELLWLDANIASELDVLVRKLIKENKQLKEQEKNEE